MKVFFLLLRWKSVFSPRTVFLIMVRLEIFFLLMRLPSPNLLSFFSNGDIPKLNKAAPLNNLEMAKSQWPREKQARGSKNWSDSR